MISRSTLTVSTIGIQEVISRDGDRFSGDRVGAGLQSLTTRSDKFLEVE